MNSSITIDAGANKSLAQNLINTNFAGTVLAGTAETESDYADGLLITDEGFEAHNLPDPDEEVSDGNSTIRKYDIDGATVFVSSGDADELCIYAADTDIKDYLLDWEMNDQSAAEFLAGWGFDGTPDEADADATDVRIWCEPCYYVGTLSARIGHYVYHDDHDNMIFATVSDAQNWIEKEESGVYILANGEAGRPAYTICD